jgi:hypothetical protein
MANIAPVRTPITFGEANGNVLDRTDNKQIKMYRNGMKCLEGDKFDGKPKGLRVLLESFKNKAIMYNWFDVLTVPNLARTDSKIFLTYYGSIAMEECVSHAEDYMQARDRSSQNAQMLFHCLSDSLTTEFKAELLSEAEASSPLLRRLGGQYENIAMYTILYHIVMLVLQKVGNNMQLGLHMFLYTIFCLPLVLACLYNPMKVIRSSSVLVLSHRNKKWYSLNMDWYYIFTRILDNAVMLLPLCLLHITTSQSTYAFVSKRGRQPYRKSYKMNTSKGSTALLPWYYVIPVLFSSYIICVPSVLTSIVPSKNVLRAGNVKIKNIKIKYRRKV